jgi:predicted transposase/invertase (TIGR01784 family)
MTKIANPIYDVVFKYLMSDNKIAKLLISDLLGIEITNLELRPQEFTTDKENRTLTVYRVDFKAEIVLKNGEKLVVLIEIQKAKFTTDLIRFRKYLGEQYASKQNTIEKDDKTLPLPIITIYFLGYGLDNNKDIPIIRVKRQYLDNYNGDKLEEEEMFIETLTHDSIIVQIPALKTQRRNDLEKALSVFEAGKVQEVSINEDDYPERYKSVVRQLLKAIANEQIRKTMDVEDEILEDLEKKERLISRQKKELEENKQKLFETAKFLKELNIDIETIIEKTGLSREEIERI